MNCKYFSGWPERGSAANPYECKYIVPETSKCWTSFKSGVVPGGGMEEEATPKIKQICFALHKDMTGTGSVKLHLAFDGYLPHHQQYRIIAQSIEYRFIFYHYTFLRLNRFASSSDDDPSGQSIDVIHRQLRSSIASCSFKVLFQSWPRSTKNKFALLWLSILLPFCPMKLLLLVCLSDKWSFMVTYTCCDMDTKCCCSQAIRQ